MNAVGPDNARVREDLSRRVVAEFLPNRDSRTTVEVGPLEVNCYSICFWITSTAPGGRRSVYVKIPKNICYDKARERIIPLSEGDRRLAKDEYGSLLLLARQWPGNASGVQFVKPVGFVPEYNAIVTERIDGAPFFRIFRRADLRRKREAAPDDVHGTMARLGQALTAFHLTSSSPCTLDGDAVIQKMARCCTQLRSLGVTGRAVADVMQRLEAHRGVMCDTFRTNTLKGLDVRQVFVDGKGVVFMLDPGKTKVSYREADVARFVVTCRILYWGTLRLFVRDSPDASYEGSFLRGYYGDDPHGGAALHLLIVKELLKHWRMALTVLGMRHWPTWLKIIMRKTYVDPFYQRQLRSEFAALERFNNG